MRTFITLVAVVALAAPVAALADDSAPSPAQTAAQVCKAELAKLGAQTFAQTYANFGACVSKNTAQATQDAANAAKTCKAEQADAGFASAHDGKSFAQYYGANGGNGKGAGSNAFGKCVAQHAQQAAQHDVQAVVSAAKTCKSLRTSDPAGFATKYGKPRNAFGKCVAAKGK
jgi:hypothetical protein